MKRIDKLIDDSIINLLLSLKKIENIPFKELFE